MSIEVENVVAGRLMDRSLADFVRACEAHIVEEAERPNCDTAVVALLCDAVRLAREVADRARKSDAVVRP